jgi:hypothetical protein
MQRKVFIMYFRSGRNNLYQDSASFLNIQFIVGYSGRVRIAVSVSVLDQRS